LAATLAVVVATSGASAAWFAPAASADPDLAVKWRVDARTHLAKLDREVVVPRGTFTGVIDLGTGELTGDLSLPTADVRLDLGGLVPLVDATFAISQAEPITGHVDFSNLFVTSTAVFDIRIISARPLGSDVNLVGDDCKTSEPISVTMDGTVDLANGSTFSGDYAIPPLETCGLLTPALNLVIPGEGNTFTGTFTPPPPPDANAGPDVEVASHATFQLDASGSTDPEDRPLTFQWAQIGGPPAVLTNDKTARPTVEAPAGPATLTFRVTVTNSDEVTDTDTVTVNVAPK
jgi:hypothetical protein